MSVRNVAVVLILKVLLWWKMSMSCCLRFEGKCRHHMIWSEVERFNMWSSGVSWRAEPLCDNRPDGQRTGKAWLGKHHMIPTIVCLFFLVYPFHSLWRCFEECDAQLSSIMNVSATTAAELPRWPRSIDKVCWTFVYFHSGLFIFFVLTGIVASKMFVVALMLKYRLVFQPHSKSKSSWYCSSTTGNISMAPLKLQYNYI